MQHEIKLMYSPDMPRRAAFAFCRKSLGPRFVIGVALLIVWAGRMTAHGTPDWLDGAMFAALGIYVLSFPLSYLNHYRNSMQKLRGMGKPEAALSVDAKSITFNSALGTMTMPWNAVKEIWRFNEFWLFVYYNASYTTIPLARISTEQQRFLIDCVENHGGKVS